MFLSDHTVGCDALKHFSLVAVLDGKGDLVERSRLGRVPGAIGALHSQFPPGTPLALEALGSWYWLVDEIE